MNLILSQIITGSHPTAKAITVSFLDKVSLSFIYLLLGAMASLSIGIAIGGLVGTFRSIGYLLNSKTAWLSAFVFLFITYLGISFSIGTLPIAGNIGDLTGYQMQAFLVVGCILSLPFSLMFAIGLLGIGSKELAMSNSFSSYASVFGFLILYSCGFMGLLLVFSYITTTLSPKLVVLALIFYPFTFFVAPIVMVLSDGIWLPLVLHVCGILGGGFLLAIGKPGKYR